VGPPEPIKKQNLRILTHYSLEFKDSGPIFRELQHPTREFIRFSILSIRGIASRF